MCVAARIVAVIMLVPILIDVGGCAADQINFSHKKTVAAAAVNVKLSAPLQEIFCQTRNKNCPVRVVLLLTKHIAYAAADLIPIAHLQLAIFFKHCPDVRSMGLHYFNPLLALVLEEMTFKSCI